MKEQDLKQLATNTANIDNITKNVDKIYLKVSNEIPHQIASLDDRMDCFDVKLGQMGIKIALIVSFIISMVNIAIQYFINK